MTIGCPPHQPPPEPLNRGACAVVRASSCLSATASGRRGAFGCPKLCGLGDFIGIGWKGTRISLVGRHARSPPHGPRTVTIGPLLKGRETRLTDGFPVTRVMLFEQAVPDQYIDPPTPTSTGATKTTPRERRSRSLLTRTVDDASVTI